MDQQKSNCEENDSETAADDGTPQELAAPPEGETEPPETPMDTSGTPVRVCALCNCEERSLHGQRELRQFRPCPAWPPPEERDVAAPLGGANDDLSSIGFSEHIPSASLLDETGHCWVHHWCAVWSEGVVCTDDQELKGVDEAVISGIRRRCEYCKRLGATIRCKAEGCTKFYHFPCSAASGSFQSLKHLTLLCGEHIEKAVELAWEEARCAVCDSAGELADLLFCTGCGQHYHAACLEISATPLKRSGWQCPECKVCQACRQPGEDSMMLVCDACDKGYHTFCLQPAMESLPSDPWKCRRCRVCRECGARGWTLPGNAQRQESYTVCDSCWRQRSSACPICGKASEPPPASLSCCRCCRWVHTQCVPCTDSAQGQYTCYLCQEPPPANTTDVPSPAALSGEAQTSTPMETEDGGNGEAGPSPAAEEMTENSQTVAYFDRIHIYCASRTYTHGVGFNYYYARNTSPSHCCINNTNFIHRFFCTPISHFNHILAHYTRLIYIHNTRPKRGCAHSAVYNFRCTQNVSYSSSCTHFAIWQCFSPHTTPSSTSCAVSNCSKIPNTSYVCCSCSIICCPYCSFSLSSKASHSCRPGNDPGYGSPISTHCLGHCYHSIHDAHYISKTKFNTISPCNRGSYFY
ncbi:hypothetical protein GJAV_G00177560 [Gymnothorax javanicus]|nr:hypothetical protein GJAV_G00177560 [Gymnothorax javanicus]